MSVQIQPTNQAQQNQGSLSQPPPALIMDTMILQLESAMDMMKAPGYVNEAAKNLIDAMKRWSTEGK